VPRIAIRIGARGLSDIMVSMLSARIEAGATVPTVLFDGHQLGRRQTGNETYVREVLRSLVAAGGSTIDVLVERAVELDLVPRERLHRVPRNGFARLAVMTVLARRLRPDVLHAIYFLPPASGTATVLTVHDISFERYPEFFSRSALLRDRVLIRRSALSATRVVTVSEASRRDLIEIYGLDPARVVAIPNGVGAEFQPADAVPPLPATAGRALRVLAVGTVQPRKNLGRLIDAIRIVSSQLPVELRVVGPDGYQGAAIRDRLSGAADVTVTGYVSDADLAAEYRRSDVLVYPSIYEGFGLPVIEAMASGIPVVTSTGGSLPEVAGGAALIVDPLDVDAIASAVTRIAREPGLAATLRERGLARARDFSWERSARAHLEVYREVAAGS
jgi:glycosyltransferase involved in cell wall biosynthesis